MIGARASLSGTAALCVALREGVSARPLPDGRTAFASPAGESAFAPATPGVRAAIERLAHSEVPLAELEAIAGALDGETRLAALFAALYTLAQWGLLRHLALAGGRPLASIHGLGRGYRFEPRELDAHAAFALSRFAYLRREGRAIVLESPLGHARVVLHDPAAAAIVARLAAPCTLEALARALPETGGEAIAALVQLLLAAGALTACDGDAEAEERDSALAQWSFHDLVFHSRSRYGRHGNLFGAVFRHAGAIEPLPALRPSREGDAIDLPRPDLARLRAEDAPFARVVEDRVSVYEYGEPPIALAQLGEFLYRTARVRGVGLMPVPGAGSLAMEVSSRPYPSGGRSYELEIYPVVDRCEGLERGLYHYDPLAHRLTRLRASAAAVEGLIAYAGIASQGTRPQVLLEIAARFQRVSWKYDSIAYATTLKNLGVLYQTMYLTATAMGLAPCALGSGDADAFAAAAGTDYLRETTVGEFMLGSRGAGGPNR